MFAKNEIGVTGNDFGNNTGYNIIPGAVIDK